MKEYSLESVLFLKVFLTIIFQSLLVTAFKGKHMQKNIKKYVLIVTAAIAVLNLYGLYQNIEYYIAHSYDPVAFKMVFINFLEVVFTIYLLYAFSYKTLSYTEKTCIIVLSLLTSIVNTYYFVLDLTWQYDILSILFWLFSNIVMVVFSIGIIIYISKLSKFTNKVPL